MLPLCDFVGLSAWPSRQSRAQPIAPHSILTQGFGKYVFPSLYQSDLAELSREGGSAQKRTMQLRVTIYWMTVHKKEYLRESEEAMREAFHCSRENLNSHCNVQVWHGNLGLGNRLML